MQLVIELVILALVLFVAVELVLLRIDLAKSRKIEAPEPDERGGPTINVNLGMPTGNERPTVVSTNSIKPERVALEARVAEEPTAIAPPAPPPAPKPEQASSRSGPGVVICSTCKRENSSYRMECFNCGASLH